VKHRLSVWIAFAALILRLVAPLTAYAAPAAFIGEICSARVGASASAGTSPGTPQAPLDAHLLSHCADCPCGTSSLALPAAYTLAPPPRTPGAAAPAATLPAPLARAILLPPPRGPPSIAGSA
jgi:hypothetical protein